VQSTFLSAKLIERGTDTLLSLPLLGSSERCKRAADTVALVAPTRTQGLARAIAEYFSSFATGAVRLTALDPLCRRTAPAAALHELSAWWAGANVAADPTLVRAIGQGLDTALLAYWDGDSTGCACPEKVRDLPALGVAFGRRH
jgi:hypothetical protein